MPFPLDTEPATVLRGAGLRVTGPRVAALAELREAGHVDVDSLARRLRARLGRVSTQAVYDVLRVLTDAGLVRRIEPAGAPARYELDGGDNHHHLVCRSCGTLVDCRAPRAYDPVWKPRPPTTASSSTRPRSSIGACAPAAKLPLQHRIPLQHNRTRRSLPQCQSPAPARTLATPPH